MAHQVVTRTVKVLPASLQADAWSEPVLAGEKVSSPSQDSSTAADRLLRALHNKHSSFEYRLEEILEAHERRLAQKVEEWLTTASSQSAVPAQVSGDVLTGDSGHNSSKRRDTPGPIFQGASFSRPDTPMSFADAASEDEPVQRKTLQRGSTVRLAPSRTKERGIRETIRMQTDMQEQLKRQRTCPHIRDFMKPFIDMKTRRSDNCRSSSEILCFWPLLMRDVLKVLVKSQLFDFAVCLIIVLNAIFIGWDLDSRLGQYKQDPKSYTGIPTSQEKLSGDFNVVFMIMFSTELGLRLVAEGPYFFSCWNSGIGWNVFDTLMVLSSISEVIFRAVEVGDGNDLRKGTSVVRMLKILQMTRSFRIVRVVRMLKDLRVMLSGILHSLKSLAGAGLLLLGIMYMTSIVLLQFASIEVESRYKENTGSLTAVEYEALLLYYGDLFTTIYTLYSAICGGIDWADAALPIWAISPMLGLFFCAYIAFAVLCVLNIVTGVFVDNANHLTSQDDELVLMEQLESRKAWLKEVQELFQSADKDNSGTLCREEFTEKMQDIRLQTWLRKVGIQIESYSSEGLFYLLDFDGNGELDIDEFALAVQSIHGNARAIDVAKVGKEAKMLRKDVAGLTIICEDLVKQLKLRT